MNSGRKVGWSVFIKYANMNDRFGIVNRKERSRERFTEFLENIRLFHSRNIRKFFDKNDIH